MPFLNQWGIENDLSNYITMNHHIIDVAELGFKLEPPRSTVRCSVGCTMKPGYCHSEKQTRSLFEKFFSTVNYCQRTHDFGGQIAKY